MTSTFIGTIRLDVRRFHFFRLWQGRTIVQLRDVKTGSKDQLVCNLTADHSLDSWSRRDSSPEIVYHHFDWNSIQSDNIDVSWSNCSF